MTRFFAIFAVLALTACTWVEHTNIGKEVTLVKAFHVAHCKKLGQARTVVKDNIGFFDRDAEQVREELVILAQNEAAVMNGDTIVALEQVKEGSLSFDVYRCQTE